MLLSNSGSSSSGIINNNSNGGRRPAFDVSNDELHAPHVYSCTILPRVNPFGPRAQVFLCILHMIVSGGWIIGTVVFQENVAWFMSGCVGYFHMVTTVLCMTQVMRTVVHHELKHSIPTIGAATTVATLPPLRWWHTQTIVAYLVSAVAATPLLVWYMITLIQAKTLAAADSPATTVVPSSSPTPPSHYQYSPYVRQLAHAMWHENPGAPIVVLVFIAITLVVLLADIIIASILYVYERRERQRRRQQQQLRQRQQQQQMHVIRR